MKKRLSTLILLALLLTSCQSSLFTDLVTSSGSQLYWDDFSSPETSDWPQVTDVNSTLGFVDGLYRMTVAVPNYQTWAVSSHIYSDVRVEADVVRNAGPLINLMGLICRYQDADNFYFFVISSDGYFSLGKFSTGVLSLVGQDMMAYSAAILLEGSNHLRFDCNGSTLAGYVNDTLVAMTDDASFRDGDAGLTAGALDEGGVDVSFDNFVVYKP